MRERINWLRGTIIVIFSFCSLRILTLWGESNHKHSFNLLEGKAVEKGEASFWMVFLSFIYLIFFISGVLFLINFLIKKKNKQPIFNISSPAIPFPLSKKETRSLILLIGLAALTLYSLGTILNSLTTTQQEKFCLTVISNLLLELTVASLILKYITLSKLGFSPKIEYFKKSLFIYLSIIPLLFILSLINIFIIKKTNINFSVNPAITLFFELKDKFIFLILLLEVVVFGPVAEELFFRGFIYKVLRKKFSPNISTLITSIFFSLTHHTPQNILPLFLLSATFCFLYEKTQDISVPIFLHSLHNFSTSIFLLVIKYYI